jgi:hypothetical protein
MNKNLVKIIVIGLILGAVGFFVGMKYGQTAKSLAGLSQTQKQALAASLRGPGNGRGPGGRNRGGNGFAGGQILSKDDKSITVKMSDNSSKIIFYSPSTTIAKTVDGAAADLVVGKQVVINGTANSDGSIVAQNIQVRSDKAGQQSPAGN